MSVALLPVDRLVATLTIVWREGGHLAFSWKRLFQDPITVDWVRGLADDWERAERLEAFVSRFGRMQDTIATKLLPRWLLAIAETPGSQIEVLNRAERLGVLPSAEQWLEVRLLRNRLVHEYLVDPAAFADDLLLAREGTLLLFAVFNAVRGFAETRMGIEHTLLPPLLELPYESQGAGSENTPFP